MLLRAALSDPAAAAEPDGAAATAVLAPMVRLGTLPLRLLALERGAKLVYTEECVDAKLAATERSYDARLGTTDWRGAGGQCILRTCQREAGRLVVQLGTTGDTSTLLAAAKQLLDDQPEPEPEPAAAGHRTRRHRHHGIVAVDINMGCPKRVATSSGSGGALFADRERCEAAVRALREFLPAVIAVTCKVRLCADAAESLERCRGLVAAGAALICVHARRACERPRDSCRWAELQALRQGLLLKPQQAGAVAALPPLIVANGDALDGAAAAEMREATGCAIVAVGRGALLAGTDVFSAQHEVKTSPGADTDKFAGENGVCESLKLCRRYAQIATDLENSPLNTSFVLQWMIHAALRDTDSRTPVRAHAAAALRAAAAALRNATTACHVAEAIGLGEYYRRVPSRGAPAPASHRYRADYFENLDSHSDWAAGPSRSAVAELRAANAAIASKPELKRSNDDFRRLATASSAMNDGGTGEVAGNSGSGGQQQRKKRKKRKQLEDHKAALLQRQQQCGGSVGGGGRPRYFVLQQSEAAEKQLGYFAPAWRCKCVLGGVPYEGGWGKSKWRAEQKAAEVALKALPAAAPAAAASAASDVYAADSSKVLPKAAPRTKAALLMPRAVRGRARR